MGTAKSRVRRWLSLVNLVVSYIRIEQEEESSTKYNAKYIASLQREIFFLREQMGTEMGLTSNYF